MCISPAPVLSRLLIEVAGAGLEPHMHADGDRAVREGLDGIGALRRRFPDGDIRAAIAHNEIVDPADFPRYQQLNVIPVLSFQWEKQAPDTVEGAREYLGPARYKYIEPAGFLAAAGARIAYGSDWPVDPLDEWFALKVGVTRINAPQPDHKYAGRLSQDKGLSRKEALRAITMNSSYELHQEQDTGSLEVGKLGTSWSSTAIFDIPRSNRRDQSAADRGRRPSRVSVRPVLARALCADADDGVSGRDLGRLAAVADQDPRQRQVVGHHGDDVASGRDHGEAEAARRVRLHGESAVEYHCDIRRARFAGVGLTVVVCVEIDHSGDFAGTGPGGAAQWCEMQTRGAPKAKRQKYPAFLDGGDRDRHRRRQWRSHRQRFPGSDPAVVVGGQDLPVTGNLPTQRDIRRHA
jgi:hypothetical protein